MILHCKILEFKHERTSVVFSLEEESDGTIRLLDLIELLLSNDDGKQIMLTLSTIMLIAFFRIVVIEKVNLVNDLRIKENLDIHSSIRYNMYRKRGV